MGNLTKEGSVWVVTAGRRAGQEVTLTKALDKNFVMAKMPKGKERKFSILHLKPKEEK